MINLDDLPAGEVHQSIEYATEVNYAHWPDGETLLIPAGDSLVLAQLRERRHKEMGASHIRSLKRVREVRVSGWIESQPDEKGVAVSNG